ncbi:MAG: hypothetical protein R6W31_15630 [Bacteroidales bacterium]
MDFPTIENPNTLLDDIVFDSECNYFQKQVFPPRDLDSMVWFFTIRPIQVGKHEAKIGSLYTLFPDTGSASKLIIERRVKEYSQTEKFEMGKYMVMTYVIEDDTVSSINLGNKEKIRRTTANIR